MSKIKTNSDVIEDPRQTEVKHKLAVGPLTRRLLSYVTRYKGRLALVAVLALVNVGLAVLVPLLMGEVINVMGEPGKTFQADVVPVIIALAVVAALLWASGWVLQRAVAKIAQDALYELRIELFDHMMSLSLNFFDRQPIGELMSRVTNDMEVINLFFSNSLSQSFVAVMTIILTVVTMLALNVPLAIVALITMPIMLGVAALLGRVAGPAYQKLQEELGLANGLMEETIAGDKTLMAYRIQERAAAEVEKVSDQARAAGVKAMLTGLLAGPVVNLTQNTQQALLALVGSLMAIQGEIGFGTVITFMTYSSQLQSPAQQLSQTYNNLLQALAGAERIFAILDEPPTVKDIANAQPMPAMKGHVVFKNVDFSYVKGRKILRDNSFEARPGQKIGLCGPTGAGKSTIMNILTRYYDLDTGQITIDGVDIAAIQQESLRIQIAQVLQEPFLFSDTVMNNLKYARRGVTDEECIAAAKQANAHGFIMSLPDGYNFMLTERGANLSAGQRQMITIARAMVANPKMLILDEATSNVDTRTEQLIQAGLVKLMEGKTSFVIAHRLSTIRDSDLILVIDKGAIIERGTHDQLMSLKGLYHNLYMSQFRGKLASLATA